MVGVLIKGHVKDPCSVGTVQYIDYGGEYVNL